MSDEAKEEEEVVEAGDGTFGMLHVADPCAALHMSILYGDGVMLAFCQPISWLKLEAEDALHMAKMLTEAAHKVLAAQKEDSAVH